MNSIQNIKIQGFFQIIQSIFIVLIYNILAVSIFPPEISDDKVIPSVLYIFSSQIVGFLFTGFTLIILFKVNLPDNYLKIVFTVKNLTLLFAIGIIAKVLLFVYDLSFMEILPPYMIPSYLNLQSQLLDDYKNLVNVLTDNHIVFLYLIGALLPAICEEFFFRGYLQNLMMQYFKPTTSILVTSLIFSFFHFQMIATVPLFLFGIALGYLNYKTKNFIYPVILHFANNASSLFIIQSGL